MNDRTFIKDFYGKILGTVEYDSKTGDGVARNFYGVILGYYNKKFNQTKDFYGRILAQGDLLSSLINDPNNQKK